jgi:phosphoribosyl 1,2-cyclic phosphate phosphodiesterase
MKILFLGTAAAEGWPGLFCTCDICRRALEAGGKNIRTRPSMLIDGQILIDPGPDLYHHVLTHGLRLADLSGILVTHSHADHIAAREFHFTYPPFAYRDMTRPLPVCGNAEVLDLIRKAVRCDDDAEIRKSFALDLCLVEPGRSFQIADHTITPLWADHAETEQCVFYHVETAGKSFLQANDTGYLPDQTWAWLENRRIDGVSLDCTNGKLKDRKNHMGVDGIIDVVERLRKQGQLAPTAPALATHFSHNGGLLHHELESALGPADIAVAYDGLEVSV